MFTVANLPSGIKRRLVKAYFLFLPMLLWMVTPINADALLDPVIPSTVRTDEDVVFFQTAAWLDERDKRWHIPIHAWVYQPEQSHVRKGMIELAFKTAFGLGVTEQTQNNFNERVNLFLADNKSGRRLSIRIAGHGHTMPPTQPNGQVFEILSLSAHELTAAVEAGFVTYKLVLPASDGRVIIGATQLVKPRGITVVSDIDDTVKWSYVTDTKRLFESTFYRDFEPIPAIAERFFAWTQTGAVVHFVSSSPWQLYLPLNEFLTANGFPFATLSLKDVRFKDTSVLNLFKSGEETKPQQIERLLRQYPRRQFVLVGDSGEQDPEIYAALMRRFPEQIVRIYIHNVTAADTDDARFAPVFKGIDSQRWRLFTDPNTLELPVSNFVEPITEE